MAYGFAPDDSLLPPAYRAKSARVAGVPVPPPANTGSYSDYVLVPPPEEVPNVVERTLTDPWARGMFALGNTGDVIQNAVGLKSPDSLEENVAERARQSLPFQMPAVDAADMAAVSGGDIGRLLQNPGLLTQVITESIAGTAPTLAAGAAVTGLSGGTLAPVGAAIVGAGGFAAEYSDSLLQSLQSDPRVMSGVMDLSQAISDPEIMGKARDFALARGIPIAAIDALSVGLLSKVGHGVGKFAEPLLGKAGATAAGAKAGATVAGAVAEAGGQTLADMFGEASAQVLSTGEVQRPGDVWLEGAAGLGMAPLEHVIGNPFKPKEAAPTVDVSDEDLGLVDDADLAAASAAPPEPDEPDLSSGDYTIVPPEEAVVAPTPAAPPPDETMGFPAEPIEPILPGDEAMASPGEEALPIVPPEDLVETGPETVATPPDDVQVQGVQTVGGQPLTSAPSQGPAPEDFPAAQAPAPQSLPPSNPGAGALTEPVEAPAAVPAPTTPAKPAKAAPSPPTAPEAHDPASRYSRALDTVAQAAVVRLSAPAHTKLRERLKQLRTQPVREDTTPEGYRIGDAIRTKGRFIDSTIIGVANEGGKVSLSTLNHQGQPITVPAEQVSEHTPVGPRLEAPAEPVAPAEAPTAPAAGAAVPKPPVNVAELPEGNAALMIGGQVFTGKTHAYALERAIDRFGEDSPEIRAFEDDPEAAIGMWEPKPRKNFGVKIPAGFRHTGLSGDGGQALRARLAEAPPESPAPASAAPAAAKPAAVAKPPKRTVEAFIPAEDLEINDQRTLEQMRKDEPEGAKLLSEMDNNARRVAYRHNVEAGRPVAELLGHTAPTDREALGAYQDVQRALVEMEQLIAAYREYEAAGGDEDATDAYMEALERARDYLEEFEGMGYPVSTYEGVAPYDSSHVPETMDKADVFPPPPGGKTVNIDTANKKGPVLAQPAADAEVARWKDIAKQVGKTGKNAGKLVISLFDYTGAWSQPWKDAGYQVIQHDIKTGSDILIDAWVWNQLEEARQEGLEVVGVLAATPCTTFSQAGSQWWKTRHDLESPDALIKVFGKTALWSGAKSALEYNKMLVDATRDYIAAANPTRFHVMENPIGRIQSENQLPDPTMRFQPHNFGDPYTKRTQLWGEFATDLPTANVDPSKAAGGEGSKIHGLRGDDPLGKQERSKTPEGFAYAHFIANDPEARALAGKQPAAVRPKKAKPKPAPKPEDEADGSPAANEPDAEAPELDAAEPKSKPAAKPAAERSGAGEAAPSADRSKTGRVVTPTTKEVSFSKGLANEEEVWADAGHDPKEADNYPATKQKAILTQQVQKRFGFKAVDTDLPGPSGVKRANALQAIQQLKRGYRNMRAMAYALGLPAQAIGLNGELGLGLVRENSQYFGAYVGGGMNTVFMPGQSNSFAHEWMHAFDHFIMRRLGKAPVKTKAFLSMVTKEGGLDPNQSMEAAFIKVMSHLFYDQTAAATKALDLETAANQLNPKTGLPTVAAKTAREQLERLRAGNSRLKIPPSKYKQTAAQYGGGDPYWTQAHEMIARAFEAYVAYKLTGDEAGQTYLTKGELAYLSNADARLRLTFPKEAEALQLYAAFDTLFEQVQKSGLFPGAAATPMSPADKALHTTDPDQWHKIVAQTTVDGPLKEAVAEAKRAAAGIEKLVKEPVTTALGVVRDMRENIGMSDKPAVRRAVAAFWDGTRYFLGSTRSWVSPFIAAAKKAGTGGKMMETAWSLFATLPGRAVLQRNFNNIKLNLINRFTANLAELLQANGFRNLRLDDDTKEKIVRAMRGETGVPMTTQQKNIAAGLRRAINTMYLDLKEAGFEIGFVEYGYLKRALDLGKIRHDVTGFIDAAKKAYAMAWPGVVAKADNDQLIDLANDVRGRVNAMLTGTGKSRLDKIPALAKALRAAERAGVGVPAARAALAAEVKADWIEQSAHDWGDKTAQGGGLAHHEGGIGASFMKGRVLPEGVEQHLAPYLHNDPLALTVSYLNEGATALAQHATVGNLHGSISRLDQLVRVPEVADAIKNNPSRFDITTEEGQLHIITELSKGMMDVNRIDLLLNAAADRGADPRGIEAIRAAYEQITGVRDKHRRFVDPVPGLVAGMSTYTGLKYLSRSVMTALTEPMTIYLTTGSPSAMLDAMVTYGALFLKPNGERAQRARHLARISHLMLSPLHDVAMHALLMDDGAVGSAGKINNLFYQANFQTKVTNAQIEATAFGAWEWMRDMANNADAATGNRKAYLEQKMQDELLSHGIDREQTKDFIKWLMKNDEPPTLAEMDSENGRLFGYALSSIVRQTIQHPTRADKPMLASTPWGRLVWQIMSFNYAFLENIHLATIERAKRNHAIAKSVGYSGFEAAVESYGKGLAGFGMGMLAIGVAQGLIALLREQIFNPEQVEKWKKEGTLGKRMIELGISRSGLFGPADAVFNSWEGVKYDRDFTSLTAGAGPSGILNDMQSMARLFIENSPNTNTAEREAAKALWRAVISPAQALLLSAIGGLGPVGEAARYGTLAFGTSAGAGSWFADTVAGPKAD